MVVTRAGGEGPQSFHNDKDHKDGRESLLSNLAFHYDICDPISHLLTVGYCPFSVYLCDSETSNFAEVRLQL